MVIEEKSKWIRSPNFQKYFATGFGITRAGNTIRLDFGDEKVKFDKENVAHVSECQIIMDKKSFNAFFDLLKHEKAEESKKK